MNLTTMEPMHLKCDRQNQSHHIMNWKYEGIPENLLINAVVWLVLLIIFSFLRKIAWDYGRIAIINRGEVRDLLQHESHYNVWTTIFYGNNIAERQPSEESFDKEFERQDKGFCSWILAFFKIKDEHIFEKSGKDALQYLKFQRYLILFSVIMTIFCVGVILPVNYQGTLEAESQKFAFSTINNLKVSSLLLWIHAIGAVSYLVLAIIIMRCFTSKLQSEFEEDEQVSRTLMITNIPARNCFKNLMMQHFLEAYQDIDVHDVQFAYNIKKLISLEKKRQTAFDGFINSEAIFKRTNERPMMLPIMCGQCCRCSTCCCKEVDAIEYYQKQMNVYKELVDMEKIHSFRDPLGIAFVTFNSTIDAILVRKDFKSSYKCSISPKSSTVSQDLNVPNWGVKHAPSPDNIYWENLSISPTIWWLKAIIINSLLFILLFFLTTPSIILNLLNDFNLFRDAIKTLHSPYLVQFIPTLILWMASSLLPSLVHNSDQIIGHWTRSAEHHAVMRKTFVFLLLMVLVLPSLGLTSAKALFDYLASKDEQQIKFKWECIFIPDNGAFFVNYVITSAFIGTAAEIIRIPELFMYALKLLVAKSAAERTSVRKSIVWEFQFGAQYAWMLCVFTVVVSYSLLCPLITPFGLVYILFKHLVDRYNIFFAYGPSKIDKHIHSSAINFVIVSVIFSQAVLVFFIIVRSGGIQSTKNLKAIFVFSITALIITMIIFLCRVCFGWFKLFGPITYKKIDNEIKEESNTEVSKPFIPNILKEESTSIDNLEINMPINYGTTEIINKNQLPSTSTPNT